MESLRQFNGMLNQFSALSTYVIVAAFAIHLFVFFTLSLWARRDLRNMASALFDFTRGLKHQSLLDRSAPLSDQVDAFLADVNDVMDDPARAADRRSLHLRMQIMDEKRRYLNSMAFETDLQHGPHDDRGLPARRNRRHGARDRRRPQCRRRRRARAST